MAVRLGTCLLPTSINLMLHGITVSEKFLMLVGAKVLNHCYFTVALCGTMPVLLLVDQRKMILYNKTLQVSACNMNTVGNMDIPCKSSSLSCDLYIPVYIS